jgi:cell division protein FtsL
MNVVRTITILIVVAAFSLCFQSNSFGQEGDDVKKEIQELKQMMEKMQQRITDLEERNRPKAGEKSRRDGRRRRNR